MDLVLATRNQGKVDEMRPMLETLGVNLINQAETDIPSPEEDGATFVENALIKALANQADRSAYFYCCMVFLQHADDPTPLIASGQWPGEILHQPRGKGGFGYDPLFWIPEQLKTAAELSKETKNRISHRGQACAALLGTLRAQTLSS